LRRFCARPCAKHNLKDSLQGIRDQFETPEDINDSPLTAPSKRVELLIPGYQKPLSGTLAALEVGIEAILAECPNFRRWIGRLIDAQAALGR
jgi:hypothetical protein